MTAAMVDRLFWRAGFGPTQAQRDAWVGKKQSELVDWFLNTPEQPRPRRCTPPKTATGSTDARPARRPTSSSSSSGSTACSARSTRCRERLAFFWHRHWAISRDDGSVSDKWALAYRNRLLRTPTSRTYPDATFRQLAYEMTTTERGDVVVPEHQRRTRKAKPNENYAREFMELFCLGPNGAGRQRQLQPDRRRRARAGASPAGGSTAPSPGGRRHAEPGLRQDHVHARASSRWRAKTFLGPHDRRRSPARRTRRPTRPA